MLEEDLPEPDPPSCDKADKAYVKPAKSPVLQDVELEVPPRMLQEIEEEDDKGQC